MLQSDTIDAAMLRSLLLQEVTIFTTRDNSCTFDIYNILMDSIFDKNPTAKEARKIFYKEDDMSELDSKRIPEKTNGFVVLASNYYQPRETDSIQPEVSYTYRKCYVKHQGKIQRKDMNIYFPALRAGGNKYKIPTVAQRFIKAIDPKTRLNDIYKTNTIRDTAIIHDLNKPKDK